MNTSYEDRIQSSGMPMAIKIKMYRNYNQIREVPSRHSI